MRGTQRLKIKNKVKGEVRVWALCARTVLYLGFGVRIAHTVFDFLFYLPLCTAEKNRNHAEG